MIKNFVKDYVELLKLSADFSKRYWFPILVIYVVFYGILNLYFNNKIKKDFAKLDQMLECGNSTLLETKEELVGHARKERQFIESIKTDGVIFEQGEH